MLIKDYENNASAPESADEKLLKTKAVETALWVYDYQWWVQIVPKLHFFA